jgi:hypothetical protein
MPISVAVGLAAAKQIDGCLDLFKKYAGRLKADPDKAASDLVAVLEEIKKSCAVLDDAVSKYLNLGFKKDAFDDAALLLELEGGKLAIFVKDGLGSCHKMANIYDNSVNRWFERVFRGDTVAMDELNRLFWTLRSADGDMFDLMEQMADELQEQANATLTLVTLGKPDDARAQVRAALHDLSSLRAQMNELMAKLYSLRAEFVAMASV